MNKLPSQEIAELKAGSEPAFRKLVEANLDQVVNICYRFTLNRAEAEDLAQDTFLEVYFSLKGFRGDSSLSTWIYQIAVRKSLDHLRSKNRLKRKAQFTTGDDAGELSGETTLQNSSDPLRDLENAERQAVLQSALDKLPTQQSVSFLLSKCEEMSYEAIADILCTSVSAVTSLIHRAKQNLRTMLLRHYDGHESTNRKLSARKFEKNRLTKVTEDKNNDASTK